ncbi:MAG: hypothetical protein K0U38_00035 [Epsilonproteobacteria bacterium]|nr:hypothetical protein [Campylobacterota bacterium]
MKKLIHLLLITSAFLWAGEKLPNDVKQIIPKGYTVLNFTKGNLNRDKIDDAILILKREDENPENYSEASPKRPLYILVGKGDNRYTLVAENNNSVLGIFDGGVFGDPFEGVTIKNGYFSVEHYGGSSWRWTQIVTFKYNAKKKSWFLHKDGGDSFHSAKPDEVETKVLTVKDFGVVKFEDYNIFK